MRQASSSLLVYKNWHETWKSPLEKGERSTNDQFWASTLIFRGVHESWDLCQCLRHCKKAQLWDISIILLPSILLTLWQLNMENLRFVDVFYCHCISSWRFRVDVQTAQHPWGHGLGFWAHQEHSKHSASHPSVSEEGSKASTRCGCFVMDQTLRDENGLKKPLPGVISTTWIKGILGGESPLLNHNLGSLDCADCSVCWTPALWQSSSVAWSFPHARWEWKKRNEKSSSFEIIPSWPFELGIVDGVLSMQCRCQPQFGVSLDIPIWIPNGSVTGCQLIIP